MVLLKRKIQILGSHKEIFSPRSAAMRRKNVKVRFQKLGFAAKMITSKHALKEMNKYFVLVVILSLSIIACQESNHSANDNPSIIKEQHEKNIKKLIAFFDQHAYQPTSGVYLSEIDDEGQMLSQKGISLWP